MIIDNTNPYVGLRPFETDESILFFGRSEQTLELLQRLHQHHFVAVVGSSGSGKSSLLRAGLIPALKAGYLVDESDHWFIAIMKPGQSPLYNLAEALLRQIDPAVSDATILLLVQKIKEEGVDAVLHIILPLRKQQQINFFLLVDQFEELFRFSIETNDAAKKDEAIDFVNILLELSGNTTVPVYIVFTMRSDFIGDCSQFYGLPEALNKSQYLVPRLTRLQLKNAIEGPAKLYAGKINPALTSRLLNDVQNVKDELPLLQHVLMRTWDYEMKKDRNGEIDLHDYKEVGFIDKALSDHADEAMKGLNDDEKHIAQLMFQSLTTTDHGGRKIRKPAHISVLEKLTGATADTLYEIIDHFNEDKRSFLIVNKSAGTGDPLIDISHESLIRQWETLGGWVDAETESAKTYLQLSNDAMRHKQKRKGLLDSTELLVAVNWRNTTKPNETWAGRYNNIYTEAIDFLDESIENEKTVIKQKEEALKKAMDAEEQIKTQQEEALKSAKQIADEKKNNRRKTQIITAGSFLFVIAIVASVIAFIAYGEAQKQTKKAKEERDIAKKQTEEALYNKNMADSANKRINDIVDSLNVVLNKLNPADRAKLVGVQKQLKAGTVYKIDVFYMEETIDVAKPRGESLVATLRASFPNYNIQLRLLSIQANARSGYGIKENLIRCETDEADVANKVLGVIKGKNIFSSQQPRLQIISYPTPNYISIFVRNN